MNLMSPVPYLFFSGPRGESDLNLSHQAISLQLIASHHIHHLSLFWLMLLQTYPTQATDLIMNCRKICQKVLFVEILNAVAMRLPYALRIIFFRPMDILPSWFARSIPCFFYCTINHLL